jgi:hypothetical protein
MVFDSGQTHIDRLQLHFKGRGEARHVSFIQIMAAKDIMIKVKWRQVMNMSSDRNNVFIHNRFSYKHG